MSNLPENLRLYDNTRLSDYRRCPRFYFFRHVMHWTSTGERRAPLIFGGAWHAAMDSIWWAISEGQQRQEAVALAYKSFLDYWIANGMPPPDQIDMALSDELSPRTPGNAYEMLNGYFDARQRNIREVEIIEIERPFAVPLSPDDPTLFYIGRIDKVVRANKTRVRGIEHKTTTSVRGGPRSKTDYRIGPAFAESFSPNSQVDGYLYALHLLFPGNDVDIWVDAALVHRQGEDFMYIPIERQMQQIDAWLWETHHWVGDIERQREAMAGNTASQRYMKAFPKNTRSCFDFNTSCPYLDLCKARANPLTWDGPPGGYKEDKWDPLAHIGTPKELVA